MLVQRRSFGRWDSPSLPDPRPSRTWFGSKRAAPHERAWMPSRCVHAGHPTETGTATDPEDHHLGLMTLHAFGVGYTARAK